MQTLWYLIYYSVIYDSSEVYKRYLIENYTNLIWDIPTLLLVCHLHRKTFSDGDQNDNIKSRVTTINTDYEEPLIAIVEDSKRYSI